MLEQTKNSIIWKCAEYVVYAFFILFPFLTYKGFLYTGATTRAVNLLFVGTVFAIIFGLYLFKKNSKFILPKSPIALALGVYFVFLVIAALQGLSFTTSFWSVTTRMTGLWYFMCLGIFLYMIWAVFADEKKQRKLLLCITVPAAIFSLCTFLSLEGLGVLFKNYVIDGFTFNNSTFAAMYLFAALILAIYYMVRSEKRTWWMYAILVALVINPYFINRDIWSGNFFSFIGESQATSFAVFFTVIGLLVFWGISKIKNHNIRTKTAYGLFGISLIVMVWGVLSLMSPDGMIRKAYLNLSSGARPVVWEISENVIKERPLLGWGTDNFERVFEQHYDSRILQDEYGIEAWFDRAHNVFVDQVVDNGILGLLAYLAIYIVTILCLISAALRAPDTKDRLAASMLVLYFTLHLLELQTAFDTSISYPILAVMFALAIIITNRTRNQLAQKKIEMEVPEWLRYIVGAFLVIFFGWTLIKGWLPYISAQRANAYIRTVGSADLRMPRYDSLFHSPIDPHVFIWRTSTDFQRGIGENPDILNNPKKVESLKKELGIMEEAYRNYVNTHPQHFRARLNFADILIYSRLFEMDKLEEAHKVLDEAIKQVPTAPQSYWMKSVAYLYQRKFDLARQYAQKAVDVNPDITESQTLKKQYIEESIKNFPNIDLYFFRHI